MSSDCLSCGLDIGVFLFFSFLFLFCLSRGYVMEPRRGKGGWKGGRGKPYLTHQGFYDAIPGNV